MSHRSSPPSASRPGSIMPASAFQMMRPTPIRTDVPPTTSKPNGVYSADAPDGYVALTVYIGGRRVVKIEIAQEYYSSKWFRFFQTFVRRNAPAALRLVD